jgi:hypothetical protein
MKKPKTIKYTNHVLQRMAQRKINKQLVQDCVDAGAKEPINGSYHYRLKGLTVVLGKSDVTVVTTYWDAEIRKD